MEISIERKKWIIKLPLSPNSACTSIKQITTSCAQLSYQNEHN